MRGGRCCIALLLSSRAPENPWLPGLLIAGPAGWFRPADASVLSESDLGGVGSSWFCETVADVVL